MSCAPSPASLNAIARPIPRDAPVTSAVLPSSELREFMAVNSRTIQTDLNRGNNRLSLEGFCGEDLSTLFEGVSRVGFQVTESVFGAARPGDFHGLSLCVFAQSKGQCEFALRAVT